MLGIAATGVGLWLLLRGGNPRKEAAPRPGGGSVKPEPTQKLSKDELERRGVVASDPLNLGFTPSMNRALDIGLDAAKTSGAIGGAVLSIAGAAGAATAAVAPLVAAAPLVIGGGAATGFLMTQDVAGAIAGGWVGPGTFVNTGRVLGRELDKLFGGVGDNKDGTSVAAQIAWGVATGAAYFGSYVFFPIALLVQGIASLVSDENRKARGQQGAFLDLQEVLWKRWDEALPKFLEAAQKLVDEHQKKLVEEYEKRKNQTRGSVMPPPVASRELTADEVMRVRANLGWLTMGYALKLNEIHERMWVKRPHGLGVSDADHYKWGKDRDYFVANKGWVREFVQRLVSGVDDPAVGIAAMSLVKNESQDEADRLLYMGFWQANAEKYLAWMADGWGVGQTAESHAKYGRDNVGQFEGELDTAGDVLWLNVWIYWEATQRNGGMVASGTVGGYY